MMPFFSSSSYQVFGLTLQTWGTFVALGFGAGIWLAHGRAKKMGLDGRRILDLAFWIFIGAFIGARLFHVFFYAPGHYAAYPWDVIDPRQPGYAMFGGLLGAAAVFFFYAKRHVLDAIAYADAIIWGLPLGCGIGRIGCFLIHDHPGTLTHFFLGVKYPDGATRHDLGLYLSLIGFGTFGLFLWLNRKQRRPGFWFGSFMVMEGLVRFFLDFLRVADVRYFGLTPTQFFSIPLFVAGLWMLVRAGTCMRPRSRGAFIEKS